MPDWDVGSTGGGGGGTTLTAGPIIQSGGTSAINNPQTPTNTGYGVSGTYITSALLRAHQNTTVHGVGDGLSNVMRITRQDSMTVAEMDPVSGTNNVNNVRNAALAVQVEAISGCTVQPNAIHASAVSNINTTWDAVALNVVGYLNSSGPSNRRGTGAYIEGRKDNVGGKVIALEVRSSNYTGSNETQDDDYSTSGASNMAGIWVTCDSGASANPTHGAGIQVGSAAAGDRWTTGYGVAGDSILTTSPGAAYRDDSSAYTSVFLQGTHSGYGVDMQGGTFTSGAIRVPNASWITARNAANGADVNVIRLNAANQIQIGTQVVMPNNQALSWYDTDGTTVRTLMSFNSSSQMVLGATGFSFVITDGCNFVPGSGTGTKFGSSATQKIGFWGATAIVRPTGWAAMTGTATRTTFATTTVTLEQLAQRVKALTDDLITMGLIGA